MTTKAINVLLCSVGLIGIIGSAHGKNPAHNVAKLMYRAANPKSGFEKL